MTHGIGPETTSLIIIKYINTQNEDSNKHMTILLIDIMSRYHFFCLEVGGWVIEVGRIW